MEKFLWFFATTDVVSVVQPLIRPLVIGLALYQTDYLFLFLRHLARIARGKPQFVPLQRHEVKHAGLVLPTLLRHERDLDGLVMAVESVVANEYPGQLDVVCSIDDRAHAPDVYRQLQRWVRAQSFPSNVRVHVTGAVGRKGKAMAIEHGVEHLRTLVTRGALAEMPEVFFNMDADSELSDAALERMVAKLVRPRWNGECATIVASNVTVRRDHYWTGWRDLFTVRGQLTIQIAREFMTSISLGRHNMRLLPVSACSGALYCTWMSLHEAAPRHAAWLRTIRFRQWLAWWFGAPPPKFSDFDGEPLPEAMIGPGDHTYVTWVASMARYRDGKLTLDAPRTPFHAFVAMWRYYFVRPIAYDVRAKVFTRSPTTVRSLFKQRIRWNGSRLFNVRRLGPGLAFHWGIAVTILVDLAVVSAVNAVVLVSLLAIPFATRPTFWAEIFAIVAVYSMVVRAAGTLLVMMLDGDASQWPKLFALPLSVPYHFVFNIITTIIPWIEDIFLFGAKTNFAPEETLIRSKTSRLALAYRFRRAFALAWRSVTRGDVPLGTFWFGWYETPYTENGYAGWTTDRKIPATVLPAGAAPEPASEPATARGSAKESAVVRPLAGALTHERRAKESAA